MAPVAGRVADRQEDRHVSAPRLVERFLAPLPPVHRIVRVLQQVGRCRVRQTVAHSPILPCGPHATPAAYPQALNIASPDPVLTLPQMLFTFVNMLDGRGHRLRGCCGAHLAAPSDSHGLGSRSCSDDDRVILDPDPASRSGQSLRIVGFSASFGHPVTVVGIRRRTHIEDHLSLAIEPRDKRIYRERQGNDGR